MIRGRANWIGGTQESFNPPMSLRKQLSDILPTLLPGNPADSIKGTELIRLTRLQLKGMYSDASLRYHFSIMSCDPASPIAKVATGMPLGICTME